MSAHSQTITQPDPKRWKALALLGFANFIVIMDSAVVQVALVTLLNSSDMVPGSIC